MNKNLYAISLFLVTSLLSSSLYAWSNYLRVVNNFNQPIVLTIAPSQSTVNNLCGGNTNSVDILPQSASCKFEFDTSADSFFSSPSNKGTLTIALKNDPGSFCIYDYDYTYTLLPFSYFDLRSENIILNNCHGALTPKEISNVNDHNHALTRSIVGNVLINIDKEKAAESTESLSAADCWGGDNCLIVAPDFNNNYKQEGSTLSQSLALQIALSRFEPLNFAQYIGSHNSAASRVYTTSTSDYNMSYADPDHYLSLTDQLNIGVRQIELDLVWFNDAVTICHNHVDNDLKDILCDGNILLKDALQEIKTWIQKNPTNFIYIYLDANLPLSPHLADVDATLALLEPYVFTPELANKYFQSTDNALPAFQLTQDSLVNQFHKNIIITNDNDVDNLKNSKYVFVAVKNSPETPLAEESVTTVSNRTNLDCNSLNKYANINKVFSDPEHYNVFRVNEDRTTINYVSSVDDLSPDQYADYYSTHNLPYLLTCPINMFSLNMLGFACNSSKCDVSNTDPRLYTFLWSWELGYPVKGGSHIAYINKQTGHFANDTLTPDTYGVLCYHKISKNTPDALSWYIQTIQSQNTNDLENQARKACQDSNGLFAVPTTSYWMSDILNLIKNNDTPDKILVNYQLTQTLWLPNDGAALTGNISKMLN